MFSRFRRQMLGHLAKQMSTFCLAVGLGGDFMHVPKKHNALIGDSD